MKGCLQRGKYRRIQQGQQGNWHSVQVGAEKETGDVETLRKEQVSSMHHYSLPSTKWALTTRKRWLGREDREGS